MKTIVCSQCGKAFLDVHRSKPRFCSRKCSGISKQVRISKECAYCGKVITDIPKTIKRRKYCSYSCAHRARGNAPPGTIPCKFCGKDFEPIHGKKEYCSGACSKKYRMQRCCAFCGATFVRVTYRQKYCSDECIQQAQTARAAKKITCTCKQCGIEFFGKPSAKRQFCSNRCKTIAQDLTGPKNPRWRGGYRDSYRGPNWKAQSSKARERDNHTCQDCGRFQIKPLLPVHHKKAYRDFNGDYKKANRLSNLITLCRNCHSKTEGRSARGYQGWIRLGHPRIPALPNN